MKKNKRAIGWLTVAHLVNDTYSGFLNPIMPFIAAKIGITMAIATVIMGIAQICASSFQPVFGFLADKIVKRFFIFWGLIFASVFIPLSADVPNVVALIICIILGNLGGSLFHPQALGVVSHFSKGNFVYNMGVFISAGTIGFSIGPVISALVAEKMGFEKIPYLSLIGIIIALLMFKFVPKLPEKKVLRDNLDFKKTFNKILSNKNILILMIISLMKSLITSSSMILLPFLWKDMGYSPSYIGLALFMFMILGGIGSFMSGKIEDLIGAKNVFYISMIATLPIMSLFVLTYQNYPLISVMLFIFMGFVTMLAMPVIMVMAQRLLPEYKSIVSGFINGFTWAVAAIFIMLVGFMAQEFGVANALLIVSIVPAIFSYFVKFLPEKIDSYTIQ